MLTPARKATNVSLDAALLGEARSLNINLSRAAEDGIRAEVARLRAASWQHENAEALASSNRYVAGHGLPLARHRQF